MLENQISDIQVNLLKYLKTRVLDNETQLSKELKNYRKDQSYYNSRNFQICAEDEFIQSLICSNVVYIGDFHTFDHNIKNVLRIAQILNMNRAGLTIGIEFIQANKQKTLDHFLAGHITEMEFLDEINYTESWRFPWSHYRQIFDFCKKNKVSVVALNSEGKLSARDKKAAALIATQMKKFPTKPLLVLFGELHILPNKIPQLVKMNCSKTRHSIIHQNLDEVFLATLHIGEQIFKYNANEFCLNNSPPWLKYESQVYWYENYADDPEFDLHEYTLENGLKTFNNETQDNFLQVIKIYLDLLKPQQLTQTLDDFNLFDHKSIKQLKNKTSKLPLKTMQSFVKECIEKNESLRLPMTNSYYCSNYSANRMISLALVHIYFLCSEQVNKLHQSKELFKTKPQFFTYFVFLFTHSYLLSKFLNPHRKCNLYSDFKKIAEEDRHAVNLLKLIDSKKFETSFFEKRSFFQVYKMAKKMGALIGEHLHIKISNEDLKIGADFFAKYFYNSNLDEAAFYQLKNLANDKLNYQELSKRYF
ncbi:MAG: ChaN family lipoprotein [Bacteriovoracaceae bacterium]|nr:ChaN family lipoprotein [Bacteriovoracaceae bacterium]